MIENDSQRRVLGHCMLPRTVSDIQSLLVEDGAACINLDTGKPVGEIDAREVIQDLEKLGCVKSFYGVNAHALNSITENDDDVITHPEADGEFATETRGEAWAGNVVNFQPDAPYYIMTQSAYDWIRSPGPDVPPEHEGLPTQPVVIGEVHGSWT